MWEVFYLEVLLRKGRFYKFMFRLTRKLNLYYKRKTIEVAEKGLMTIKGDK